MGKEDGAPFTDADGELLVLFASQADAASASARTLRAEDGSIASVVMAMQDLAPLRALERQRAEFLGMVSHELRAPLTSIKGSTATVLGGSRVVGTTEIRQFFRIIDRQADRMDALIGDLLGAGRIEAGTPRWRRFGDARRSGAQHPPHRRRALPRADRHGRGSAPGACGSGTHRAGAEQPARQRGARCAGVLADPHRGADRGSVCRGLGRRRGARHGAGAAGAAVRPPLHDRAGRRARPGRRARAGNLQGPGGGARRAYPGLRVTFTVPATGGGTVGASGAGWRGDGRSGAVREEHEGLPILAVDDDPETLRHVREALAEARFAPIVTANPDEIERIVKAERPRLVLLDLMLLDTDGIELMRTVPAHTVSARPFGGG